MNLLAAVFSTILWPFKALISSVFTLAWELTGNYGLSLIIVSFCITAGTAPLYLLADKWKNGEKAVRGRMRRDVENINRYHSGSKRFYLTKAAHRIYGYKPWYALRTSFGLLIQIPFFFAAYHVLSEYTGYAGVSFLGIRDLAVPDGLLLGVNLLPFLMTAVNILSSLYYTRSLSVRDNGQLLVMAGVFLVLLYKSPSALLVYWTMNNLLSFVKAVIFRHVGLQKPPEPEPSRAESGSFLRRFLRDERDLAVFFSFALVCSLEVFWIVNFKETFKYAIALSLFGAVLSSAYFVLRRRLYRKIPAYLVVWAALAPFYFAFVSNRKYNPYISNENLKLMIAFLQGSLAFLGPYIVASPRRVAVGSPRQSADGSFRRVTDRASPGAPAVPADFGTFAGIVVAALFFLCIYQPFSYYISSPADIGVTLASFARSSFLLVAIAAAAAFGAFFALPQHLRGRASEFALFVLMASLVWSLFFRMKTGMLDNFTFQHEDAIGDIGLLLYLLDPFMMTGFLWLARKRLSGKGKTVFYLAVALTSVLAITLAVKFARMDKKSLVRDQGSDGSLPATAADSHRFSADGKNVVFLVADMFNGNYLGRIVEGHPEYAQSLDGFVWYPDCLSVSYNTATSFPAIFGGEGFLPERLSGNGMNGSEEIRLAAGNFFKSVRDAGFRATVSNPVYFSREDTAGARVENIFGYVNYWKGAHGEGSAGDDAGDKAFLPAMVSIFNSVPWHLKSVVYDDANWIIFRRSAIFKQMRNKAIRDMAYLDLLPEVSSAAKGDGLFLYVHNELPHSPYGINGRGELIDGEFPSAGDNDFINPRAALYSARKELDLLLDLCSWMKDNGVYDNTMIVVISDHGNPLEDNGIPKGAGGDAVFGDYDLSRANTLLLVKDFGASGNLATDRSEVSSADVTALLSARAGISFPGVGRTFPPEGGRTREYSSIAGDWEDCLDREAAQYRTYDVSGSIFESESWRRRK